MKLKNEQSLLESRASDLLQAALKAGATAAEVCGAFGRKSKVSLEKQDFHLASADEGYSFGLRVLVGQKLGFSSANSTDPTELKKLATRAVEIAKVSPENPWYKFLDHGARPQPQGETLWDEELCNLSLPTQRDWAKLIDAEATADKRFRLNEGSVGVSSGVTVLLNSKGTHRLERDSLVHWGMMGMGVEGENITSFDYYQALSRKMLGTPDLIRASAQKFRHHVLKGLRCGKSHNYRGLVVFSPRAVLDILMPVLTYHLNGRNLAENTSKFKVGDLGTRILESELTVRDEPHRGDRFGYTVFDREGTPTREADLLRRGQLTSLMVDGYAAAALGIESTGHAAGGPTALPTVGSHALTIAAGTMPLQELFSTATATHPDFLVVERYSGQSDPVTGDFSGVAKSSGWWHRGEEVYQVKETLISGNAFEVLGKNLVALSAETSLVDNSEESPWLLADGVSVTGS